LGRRRGGFLHQKDCGSGGIGCIYSKEIGEDHQNKEIRLSQRRAGLSLCFSFFFFSVMSSYLKFQVSFHTNVNQTVRIVGNIKDLGEWDVSKGLQL